MAEMMRVVFVGDFLTNRLTAAKHICSCLKKKPVKLKTSTDIAPDVAARTLFFFYFVIERRKRLTFWSPPSVGEGNAFVNNVIFLARSELLFDEKTKL